jgi:starch phosphorylase
LDCEGLFRLLEQEVIPLYYDQGIDGVPHGWCTTIKHTIRTVAPQFSARRMLKEYMERGYAPLFQDTVSSQKEKFA